MLPSELLRARRRGNRLVLLWARGSELELALVRELISLFRPGRSLKEIEEEAEELERVYETFLDYKLIRGLFILLERKAEFRRPDTTISPIKAREVLYRIVNERFHGFVIKDLRHQAISIAARELGISSEELELALWADFDENLKLVSFPSVEPLNLLKEYNLSLLQTALFKAIKMVIRTRAPGRELKLLLRSIKGRGLMYTAWRENDFTVVSIDGPASILKMTTKYGTALAKIVPSLTVMSHWELWAKLVRKVRERKSLLSLEVNSLEGRELLPKRDVEVTKFDSEWERSLYNALVADGWEVEREPEALIAGSSVMIPDFRARKGPATVYIELVGFWTPDYIKKKVRKVLKVKEPLLLVVRKDLLVAPMSKLGKEVLLFDKKLDRVLLIKKLRELEARQLTEVNVKPDKDLISLRELSLKLGYRLDQLKERVKAEGYRLIGEFLLSEELLKNLREKVRELRPKTVGELKTMLKEMGLDPSLALALADALGLRISWKNLNENEAELIY